MPSRHERSDHIGLSIFLKEATTNEVDIFQQFLSPGDVRRMKFWRESVVAADQLTLTTLLSNSCQDGLEQLKDVRPDDKETFKFEDSLSEAKRYSSELRQRMVADLEAEFSKDWPGKNDVLKKMKLRIKPKKSCSTQ